MSKIKLSARRLLGFRLNNTGVGHKDDPRVGGKDPCTIGGKVGSKDPYIGAKVGAKATGAKVGAKATGAMVGTKTIGAMVGTKSL